MRLPSIDLRDYPHGSDLHGQSLNWLYANGLDPFATTPTEVTIVGDTSPSRYPAVPGARSACRHHPKIMG